MSKSKEFKPCKGCPDKRECTLNKKCKGKEKGKKGKQGSRNIYVY